jgi:NAD(P)H-dependent FMN reductase
MTTIRIAAISGSLKTTSANTNILRALAKLVPGNVSLTIVEGLDNLPHFNPDTDEDIAPVAAFRQQIKNADMVIFSTPEYAFGVPGVLKNALDWLVSSGELNEKPVAAISASPLYSGGDKALASLLLTLTALGTKFTTQSTLSIGNIKNKMTAEGIITDEATIQSLQLVLNNLIERTMTI